MQCTGTFPPELRLRNRREYLRVRETGKKIHTPHFLVYIMVRGDGPTRLGITCSRKVGGAVVRNRVKRLLREFFRQNISCLPAHADISVIAKRGAHLLDYRRACSELDCLRRINHR